MFRNASFAILAVSSCFMCINASFPVAVSSDLDVAQLSIPLTKKIVPVTRNGKKVSEKVTYSGSLSVGAPAQEFRVVFDTGSGHVVLPSVECNTPTCTKHRRFDSLASSTAVDINIDKSVQQPDEAYDEVSVSYGTGQIVGTLVHDRVCLGPATESRACTKMGFIQAEDLSPDPFDYFPADGIVGMGLSSLALDPEFSFFNTLVQSKSIPVTQFAIFISEEEEGSELSVGGVNPDRLASPLQWTPVDRSEMGYWQVKLKAIHIGDQRIDLCNDGDCHAILDSGTSHLGVPATTEKFFEDLLSVPAGGIDNCLLTQGPKISLELPGFNLTLGANDYMRRSPLDEDMLYDRDQQMDGSSLQSNLLRKVADAADVSKTSKQWCTPLLMPASLPETMGPKMFVLGEPLLRRYYTVFDWSQPSVGFGLAAPKPKTEDSIMFVQKGVGVRKKTGDKYDFVQVVVMTRKKVKPRRARKLRGENANVRAGANQAVKITFLPTK